MSGNSNVNTEIKNVFKVKVYILENIEMIEEKEKTPPTPSSSTSGNEIEKVENDVEKGETDVEKGENIKILEAEEDNEPLEKAKEKPPPGINASLVLLYAVFFTMFTTGWVNLNSCPLNRLIPIYLIVAGFVGALAKFLSKTDNKYVFNLSIILVVFDVFWHVLGTYVVYKEYQPNYDENMGIYCNRTAYLLSFWILTFQYTMMGLFIMLSACYLLMSEDFKKN